MVHTRAYLLKSIGGATICRILFKTAQSCINFNSVKEQILRIGPNGYQTGSPSVNSHFAWIQVIFEFGSSLSLLQLKVLK